jgi:hypothetical protein
MHCTLTYNTTAQDSSGVAEEPRPLVQHSTSQSAGQHVSVGTGAVTNGSTAYQPRANARVFLIGPGSGTGPGCRSERGRGRPDRPRVFLIGPGFGSGRGCRSERGLRRQKKKTAIKKKKLDGK